MPCPGFLSLAGPFLGGAVNAIVQTAGVRVFPDGGLLRWVFAGFLAGLAAAGAWDAALLSWTAAEGGISSFSVVAGNAVLYAALSYYYFHFVNLGETARRVRIMREVISSDGGLTLAEILARYDARQIVETRLARLLGNGQVEERDGRYHARKSTMLAIASLMSLLKRALPG